MNSLKWNTLGILASCLILFPSYKTFAQPTEEDLQQSCTSIMVGIRASDDGSVMTAHTCDAYYRTWLDFVPAQEHPKGTMHKVQWETMHTSSAWSNDKVFVKGEIPEAEKTFAYLNTAYPCLNEKQLAIGETSISGRKELKNDKGLFLIEELERVVLQRCTTARQGIQLIGELVKKYGYGDGGECITLADTKEVWQLEIYGAGPDTIGSVWAARRIPDDHVGISANLARIGELDLNNKDYYMASENVYDLGKKLKYWDGVKKFKFWEVYSGEKPFTIREFYVFSKLAPALKLKFDSTELPFSVKPEKKVNVRDILAFYRTTYEGTQWDLIKNLKTTVKKKNEKGEEYTDTIINPAAHPFMGRDKIRMLNDLKPDVAIRHRGISVQYCAYSWVAQLRGYLPDEIGGRLWFGFDVPQTNAKFPIYCNNQSVPESFKICGQDHFNRSSALWAFRQASRLAMVHWGEGRLVTDSLVKYYEEKAFGESGFVEKKAMELYKKDRENAAKGIKSQLCREFLTGYTNDFARSVIDSYWEAGEELWVKMRWNF
ncbi:MAG: C69 family dipeptidase [Bacteroidales bacterium]